jgi:hypothetical protein
VGISTPTVNANSHHVQRNTAVLFPGQVSTFRTARPNQGRSTYVNDNGNTRTVSRGLSLDLSSTSANITVGDNLVTGSVTIQVGGSVKEISAGSKVTAAEFAALNQKLATGEQSLTLSNRGAATGGSLNLNTVSDDGATIRASELVIPENVSVTGDFARTADGVRVTKDVVNYGSLVATSTNANRNTAVIAARDINNEVGGSISSQATASNPELNLALRADRDLNNFGSISAAGNLELSAGHALNNAGGATAQANGDVLLNSGAITNYGGITSANGDITFTAAPTSELLINNLAGNLNALNGAINLRDADYNGTAYSVLYGGNLYSKEVNINAGQGTGDLTAEDVTGKISSKGLAAHVSTNTDNLVLGEQCLTGDPTYYNTGNIIIGGNIAVGEDLALIAGGDITTTTPNLSITAREASGIAHNINIIAGANITAGSGQISPAGGPATLPNQPLGTITQNATAPVTINGASATGGNIDFSGATAALGISASASAANTGGGNITLAAYASAGGAKGQILTKDSTNREIQANGSGTGANGNISLIAGAQSGTAIFIQDVNNFNGTGTPGNISIVNAQPTSSNGLPITFSTTGSITSGNSLIPSSTLGNGTIQTRRLVTRGSVTIDGGDDTILGEIQAGLGGLVKINSRGDLQLNNIFAITNPNYTLRTQATAAGNMVLTGNIATNGGILLVSGGNMVTGGASAAQIQTQADAGNIGNVSLVAGAAFTVNANDVTITGASATGGTIDFTQAGKIQNLRSDTGGSNGDGGNMNIIAYGGAGTGKILLPIPPLSTLDVLSGGAGSGANGDITIVAGADTSDAISMGGANVRGAANVYDGDIYISTSNPVGSVTLSTAAGFANVTGGTFQGGTISPNAGIDINRALVSNGSGVTIRAGASGVHFGDVSLFTTFDVESLGDINNYGNTALVTGNGSRQNTLLWTAKGDISFGTRLLLHATGAPGPGAGGGITLIAGGTVQTIKNPLGGFEDASIESASGEDGGNITVVSGADFTRSGNTVIINGTSGSGGDILFDAGSARVDGFTAKAITHIDAHSQGGTLQAFLDGGNINLISYSDIKVALDPTNFFSPAAGSFHIVMPSSDVYGVNGNVTIVAPGDITFGKITFSHDQGGATTLRNAVPSAASIDVTPLTLKQFGSTIGSFLTGALGAGTINAPNGIFAAGSGNASLSLAQGTSINLGNLDLRSTTAGVAGGNVFIESGANVTVGTINVSNTTANGAAGTITIISNSSSALNVGGGGANGTGVLTANAAAIGDGGEVIIQNKGTGGILVTAIPSTTVTDGDGAGLTLDAGAGPLDLSLLGSPTIARNAAGTNNDGGTIVLTYTGLVIPAGNISLQANATGTGAGGTISVHNNAGPLTVGAGAGNFTLSTTGAAGTGSIDLFSTGTLTINGSVSSADNVSLSGGSNVIISTAINADDVRISANGTLTVSATITADPITLVSTGDILLNANQVANGGILIVSGGNITTNTALTIDGSNAGGDGGDVVIVAGAAFTETVDDVTITGQSATGGSIDFTTGGGSLVQLVTSSTFAGGSGGDITLLAFEGATANTGRIILTPGATVSASGSAAGGVNGDIAILAQHNSGTAVSMGAITNAAGASGGAVTVNAATPVTATAGPILKADASYTGTFTGGLFRTGSVTTGALSSRGAIDASSGGNLTTGAITTNSNTDFNAGNIIVSGENISVGALNANGNGTGSGGSVSVYSGGAITIGNITADGGNGATGGHGGFVTMQVNTVGTFGPPTISVNGNGTVGNGGGITIINNGTGGIAFNSLTFSFDGNGNGGSIYLSANGALTSNSALLFDASAGSSGFTNGDIYLSGSSISSSSNNISLQSSGGLAGTGNITFHSSGGDVVTNGGAFSVVAGNDITFDLNFGQIITVGPLQAGQVDITAGGAVIGADTGISTNATFFDTNGSDINVTAGGPISLRSLSAIPTGTGDGGDVTISSSGGSVQLNQILSPKSAVSVTSTNGNITFFGTVGTSDTLSLNMLGLTPGDATFGTSGSITALSGTGGGLITFNNGSNPLTINGIGSEQSLDLTTTAVSGMTFGANISTTGTILLNTPAVTNTQTVQAASITIQNLTGNLTVTGAPGAPGIFTGTTPAAGAPGFPSTPAAIIFNTANGANLNLFNNMTFNGDVLLNNSGGTTTSNLNSVFAGNNNVTLNTATWNQLTGGNITGNKFIFSGLSIINTDGNVVIGSNMTFTGRDLIIAARNNIDLGNFTISTASSTDDGGDITLIAGYTFTTSSGGQISTQAPFTIDTDAVGGGDILGTANLDTSTTAGAGAEAGKILVVANGGSVSLGNLTASATSGSGNNIKVIAPQGITINNINTTGPNSSGDVEIYGAQVTINNPPVTLEAGVVTGGPFSTGSNTSSALSVGSINASDGFINIESGGAITLNGTLTSIGTAIRSSNQGTLTFNGINSITALQDSGVGGEIDLEVGSIAVVGGGPLTLTATGTTTGGQIQVDTTQNLNLGTAGDLVLNASSAGDGGEVAIRTEGDLVVSTGGINAAGANGYGATISLTAGNNDQVGSLSFNDQSFLSQANATGVNADGGALLLQAEFVNLSTTPGSPLVLSATGNGTGNGGQVVYFTLNDPANTYLGVPAKTPKGLTNYLDIDVRSGTAGGNGGATQVNVTGNLTVDPIALKTGPRGVNGNGSFVVLQANDVTGKGGSLVVLDDLSVAGAGTGTGGFAILRMDSKQAFTVGAIKAPKNGILGQITTGGTASGNVQIFNDGGGVLVDASNAIVASNVTLQSSLKGTIAEGKGVTITAGNLLNLNSEAGAIGKKPLIVSAPLLQLSSGQGGSINVSDTLAGPVTLTGAFSNGGDITVTTTGGLSVTGNVTTTDGDINLTANGGTLDVNASTTVHADNGGIIVANLNTTSGDINIQNGATIETQGKGDQVVIAIGSPPKKGTNTINPDPTNITVTPTGKGQAFWGPGGVVATGSGVTILPTNKNVIFNNLSTNGKLISLAAGVTVEADPPSRGALSSTSTSLGSLGFATAAVPSVGAALSGDSADLLATSHVSAATAANQYLGDTSRLLNIATVGDTAFNSTRDGITKSLTIGGIGRIGTVTGAGTLDSANTLGTAGTLDSITLSTASTGEAGPTVVENDGADLFIDAAFHNEKDTSNHHVLNNGNALFAPVIDTVVETAHGKVELAAGSVALIMETESGLSVYDLHDQSKNAVVINTGEKRISLSPGRHVMVSHKAHRGFAHVNPIELVQYRNIGHAKLNSGNSVYTTEFAIPSVCYAVKPLKQLMASKHNLAKRIIKTTAVLTTISPDRGDFVQFFKSQTTAMAR